MYLPGRVHHSAWQTGQERPHMHRRRSSGGGLL